MEIASDGARGAANGDRFLAAFGAPGAVPDSVANRRGGMGTVYLAERDDDGLRKRVAIKMVRPLIDADLDIVRRFSQERQILATLEHPNIAHMLDAGRTPDGLPYLVMEYVEGIPLDRYAAGRH